MASSRTVFTGEQVLRLLEAEESDAQDLLVDPVDEVFFPGSDDELGFVEEEVDDETRFVYNVEAIYNYSIMCFQMIIIVATGTVEMIVKETYQTHKGITVLWHIIYCS